MGELVSRSPTIAMLVLSFVVSSDVVFAGPLEDGEAAYNRGDYATALRLLGPLAEQGNAGAQLHLGQMYAQGEGVAQDYKEATKWCQLEHNPVDLNRKSIGWDSKILIERRVSSD